jgi:hypothetical protein
MKITGSVTYALGKNVKMMIHCTFVTAAKLLCTPCVIGEICILTMEMMKILGFVLGAAVYSKILKNYQNVSFAMTSKELL